MSKAYESGDKSIAICEHCNEIVTTTFGLHDVPYGDGSGVAIGVLSATCDECHRVVTIAIYQK